MPMRLAPGIIRDSKNEYRIDLEEVLRWHNYLRRKDLWEAPADEQGRHEFAQIVARAARDAMGGEEDEDKVRGVVVYKCGSCALYHVDFKE